MRFGKRFPGMIFGQHLYFSPSLALQDVGAHAAAEYSRLGVQPHFHFLSGPDAASTVPGGCIGAVLHLDR